MKDSRIPWIGHIPQHWEVTRTKHYATTEFGYPFDSSLFSIEKGFPLIRIRDITSGLIETYYEGSYEEKYVIHIGDILVGMDGDFNVRMWDNVDALLNQRCCKVVPNKKIEAMFLYYCLPFGLKVKNNLTFATTVKHLANNDIGNLYIPLPPLTEQEAIATYLDTKCKEIDELVALQERMIEELKAYRQSVITEAVTKGLNPNAPLKESGIPWIGQIPKHWEVLKNKYILRNKSVKGYPNETVLSLYRDYGVVPKNSRDDNHNVTSEKTEEYKLVDVGDFVINKMKAWQGSMALSNFRGIISPAYYICSFTIGNIYRKYIHYLLRNDAYKPEYRRLSTGLRIGQWDLNIDDFLTMPIILPPLAEQQAIASYLDTKCKEIDELISIKQKKIARLKEFKKSMIYEHVTGKKQVAIN